METLFDYAQSRKLRDDGIKTATSGREQALAKARSIAFWIANMKGFVTADKVREEYEYRGGDWAKDLGNAAGSIFKEKSKWECVGFESSTVTTSHARALRIWKLR